MTASGSLAGPQVVKYVLTGIVSTMFWQEDNSEGGTVPEHSVGPSYLLTITLRLLSPPGGNYSVNRRDTAFILLVRGRHGQLTYVTHSPALGLRRLNALVNDIAGCGGDFLQTCTSGEFPTDDVRLDDTAPIRCQRRTGC